ncbi:MAG: CoB--CoM heterodisulfide reductase iron-sulfur subunit B family protein [Candidatus Methylomirabilales bacterium]
MSYWYYPGCSLKSNGGPYEQSLLAVFRELDTPLWELEDWNCCGATSYMSIDEAQAFSLAARNLALAEQASRQSPEKGAPQLVAPCSACFLVLTKTQRYVKQHQDLARQVHAGLRAIGLDYQGAVQVRHPLDVFVNDIGISRIRKAMKRSLDGLKVACYYGCQVVRPFATFDSAHNPTSMDRLVEALDAKPIPWPLKTRCCGGTLTGTIHDVGLRLSQILLRDAAQRGAEVVITVCPLCQFNLECYQEEIVRTFRDTTRIPVLYLTQLMGKAFGIPDAALGMRRLFVSPEPAFARHQGGQPVHA